jgi:hypothetical protein
MDTIWRVRQAYDKARQIKQAQDDYCAAALDGDISEKPFPEELQWESLVAILRGQVKVQTHCYEPVDIDNFVRLSNEFKVGCPIYTRPRKPHHPDIVRGRCIPPRALDLPRA